MIQKQLEVEGLTMKCSGHINVLELHAAKLCLWALATTKSNIHVRLLLGNTTVICYINDKGYKTNLVFGALIGIYGYQQHIFLGKKTVLLT